MEYNFDPISSFCFCFWPVVYCHSYVTKNHTNKDHFNCPRIVLLHVYGGMIFAALSLYINDEAAFPEAIILSWSAGYFAADLLDCAVRRDGMFFAHAIIGVALLYCCFTEFFYNQRAGSLGYFVEISTPFLYRWKATKNKADFRNFLVVFFLCRLVYTPFFLSKMQVTQNSFALVASAAFYVLNGIWFVKMLFMLLNYKETPRGKES